MAHVIPFGSRNLREHGLVFKPGKRVEITDEGLYHHLIRTRRFRDPDKAFTIIRADALPRLKPGASVTLVREVGLGDVLMVIVVLRQLSKTYPRLRFRLATGRAYIPLLQGLDFLDGVDSLMDLTGRIHNVIDLRDVPEHHKERERMDRIDIFALTCGVSVGDYSIPLSAASEEERDQARSLIGPGRIISIGVRGSTHVRTWPIENVRTFALLAASRGLTVAVIDPQAMEMPTHERIVNLTGQIGLVDVKAIVAESELCVSSDSGLQHVAEAVGTKCLAIYSTTPPALRIGHYRNVKAIWRESLPCVPCFDRGCPAAPCMDVAPELVMRALEDWESLGVSTNVEEMLPAIVAMPRIEVASENQIMASWVECAHCHA